MPRIVKWEERAQCVRKPLTPVKFIFEDSDTIEKAYIDLQDLINQTIQRAINRGLQYDQSVSIKEVPNG